MLSNAYFLAKFRFDTAENEPANNLQSFANFASPNPEPLGGLRGPAGQEGGADPGDAGRPGGGGGDRGRLRGIAASELDRVFI